MTDSKQDLDLLGSQSRAANEKLLRILNNLHKHCTGQRDILEQVLQRLDILEKGQKLDRTGRDMDTDDFEKLEAKVRRIDENLFAHKSKVEGMDQKLTARVNDLDERAISHSSTLEDKIKNHILDNERIHETIGDISRESARDVLDNFDFEYHHVESAVRDAIDNMDLSEHFDEEQVDVRRLDLDTLADYLVDERSLRDPLRLVDEHEERLDKMGDQMCTVITKLELMGIQLSPANNRDLYGDKRDDNEKFGDLLAFISKKLTSEQRTRVIELADNLAKETEDTDAEQS